MVLTGHVYLCRKTNAFTSAKKNFSYQYLPLTSLQNIIIIRNLRLLVEGELFTPRPCTQPHSSMSKVKFGTTVGKGRQALQHNVQAKDRHFNAMFKVKTNITTHYTQEKYKHYNTVFTLKTIISSHVVRAG